MFGFNILDILALIVFGFCLMLGIKKGFLRMTFSFISILVSFYIASRLYQPVSDFLKDNTPLYETLKERIISGLGLHEVITSHIQQGEAAVLSNLPLPQVLLERLYENNTPSVRLALGVTTLEDYIGSFLASLCIAIIAVILVFVAAILLTNLIASILKVISKLPIIRGFDKIGGALVGTVIGFFAVWTLITLYITLFVGITASDVAVFNSSQVAQFLYTHGLLLRGI